MSIFGGDLVTVTTPDGRQVQMPSDLAASFPSLQPVQSSPDGPAAMPDDQPAPPMQDPGLAPAPIVAPPAQPTPVTAGPITSPGQVPTGGPSNVPQPGPVTAPGEEQGTQPVAPPPPLTNKQLLQEGPAGTLAAQNAAIDKQARANDDVAQVQADTATRAGAILADRDAKTQKILEERARVAQENVAELQKRITARDALADKIANTRVDRSIDHPIMTAIGLILSAAGTAMKLRPGEKWDDPAYDILQQQLDRKVDTQMKNLDIQRGALAQMNVGVTEQRQLGMDRMAEVDVRRDAALQQAQQMVETMAMQMKSPLAKAQAQQLNAKLDEERATLRGQAAERLQAQVNHERQMAQAAQFHKESMDLQRQQMAMQEREHMAAIAEKMLDQKNAAAGKAAKDIAERGIWDPRTGDVQLDPQGQAKMQQADQIEAAARQNPAAPALDYIKQLRAQDKSPEAQKRIDQIEARVRTDPQFAGKAAHEYAQTLRDDARTNNGVLAPDKATADKVRPILEGTQQMTDQIDRAVQVLKAGPSGFDREAWAGLKTDLGDLAKNYAKLAGERVTVKGIENAMENIVGFDPNSFISREASKDKAISALKSLQRIVNETADSTLRGNGIKSGWKPVARSEQGQQLNIDDKTANEVEGDRSLGYLNPSRYTGGQEQAQSEAGDAAYSEYTRGGGEAGLSPNATTHIKALAARAATAGDKDRAQIVEALKGPILAGLREGGRQSVAWGTIDVLSSASPGVLKDVVDALPAEAKKRVEQELAFRAGNKPASVPGSMLTPSTYDPDRAAAKYEASPEGRAAYEQEGRDMEARRLDAKAVLERQQRRYEQRRAERAGGGR
jgi:hypothetical protein